VKGGDRLERCDVVIVGAGITGLSVAFHLLSRRARRVLVLDRSGIGAEASGVQPGGVRQQWSTRVNCLLARESLQTYQRIGEQLASTVRPTFESCGYMFLAHSPGRLRQLAADVEVQNAAGVPSEILTANEAAERVADLRTDTLVGAAWCQEDGYFDRPQAVVAAYGEAAQRLGAEIVVTEVASLALIGESWRLTFSDGSSTEAAQVVLAVGYDTAALLEPLGIDTPIVKDPRYLFLSEPIRERLLEPLVVSGERSFAAKQLADGRVLASYTAANGDPATSAPLWRQAIRDRIEEMLPRLQYVSFPILVDGYYDTTPDHQPIIGELLDGLWVAAGFSGHGFMLAPAVGRRLAAALDHEPVDELLDYFSPSRLERPVTISETDWVV
jgi:sarcosine oxidase subunit beta